jgi:hypothetical protein
MTADKHSARQCFQEMPGVGSGKGRPISGGTSMAVFALPLQPGRGGLRGPASSLVGLT